MISVIIPVYNVENYLRECLDSVLNQTYTNLEIILVDDGSTDNSGVICDEYKEKDSRIVVVHKDNGGLSDARNAGMDIAKGTYFGFVDSDDVIHPQMYEFLRSALLNTDADMASCSHTPFLDGTSVLTDTLQNSYTLEKQGNREEYLQNFLQANFTHYVWKCLYKQTLIKALRFQKGKHMEDVMFMGEISRILSKYAHIKENLYYYRLRKGSIVHTNPQIYLEHIDAMLYNLNHFKINETPVYVKKYAEFIMNHILTRRVQMRIYHTSNAYVDKQCLISFRQLYHEYGSHRKSHLLAMYFPSVYNMLKYPKLKRALKGSPHTTFHQM